MNKQELLQLNVLPEGQAAWLSYDQYVELKRLFEAVPLPTKTPAISPEVVGRGYMQLHHFLTEVAGLELPMNEPAIHFNAFALIRRGYRVERITPAEYESLTRLMEGLEQPDVDDLDLYETGGHRALYTYLTRQMGVSVQAGRGPAWHRARTLLDQYETERKQRQITNRN